MSERILVCDKSISFAGMVAGELRANNAAVALVKTVIKDGVAEGDQAQSSTSAVLCEPSWTRHSQLSAKTLVMETRTNLGGLDKALLIFDAQAFIASPVKGHDSVPSLLDDYIDSYVFLVRELSSYFLHQKKGSLFFALRPFPPRSGLPGSSETVFAIAEAAFVRLAEETASWFSTVTSAAVSCPLVHLGDGDDTEDAVWLAGKLSSGDAVRMAGKSGSPRWVKAGSRNLFGLLS